MTGFRLFTVSNGSGFYLSTEMQSKLDILNKANKSKKKKFA